jgi:FkbM family methyltransferase
MRIGQVETYKKTSFLGKLRFVPNLFFSRLMWPVISVFMPKKLVKQVGPYTLILNGKKLSHFLRYVDLWEPRYRRAMMKHVSPGSKVLELGSAYGYFTLLLVDRVGPTGAVIAVEPFPPYYKDLVRLKDSNAIFNLDLLNVGIGDSSAKFFEFGVRDSNPYLGLQNINPIRSSIEASMSVTPGSSPAKVRVPALTLPELISIRSFVPDFIVMDIEGAEIFVIEQLVQMDLRPVLFFEVHPSFTGEDEMARCLRILGETRYVFKQIDEHHFFAVYTKT